jgi:hypothetical protein
MGDKGKITRENQWEIQGRCRGEIGGNTEEVTGGIQGRYKGKYRGDTGRNTREKPGELRGRCRGKIQWEIQGETQGEIQRIYKGKCTGDRGRNAKYRADTQVEIYGRYKDKEKCRRKYRGDTAENTGVIQGEYRGMQGR